MDSSRHGRQAHKYYDSTHTNVVPLGVVQAHRDPQRLTEIVGPRARKGMEIKNGSRVLCTEMPCSVQWYTRDEGNVAPEAGDMMLSATRTLWLTARAKCARRTSLAATRVCAGKARCLSTGACDATAAVGEGVRPTERRPDEYAWMRCRDSDELKEHIRAENGFTIQSLQPSADLAQQLHHELCAYTAPAPGVLAADSLPEKWGAFEYWTDSAGEGPRMVRRRCGDPSDKSDAASSSGSSLAKDEVLLDFGALSDQYDAPHVHVATVSVSPDGAMLAFTMDACGTEEYRGVVRRLCATPCGFGEDLVGDEIASATRVTWANVPHPHLLYCVVPDDAGRPCEVWRHTVGSNRSEDERVFASSDAADWVDVVSVKDNQVITINCNTKSSSEVWILDACDRHASPKLVARREADVSYFVEHNKVRSSCCVTRHPTPV